MHAPLRRLLPATGLLTLALVAGALVVPAGPAAADPDAPTAPAESSAGAAAALATVEAALDPSPAQSRLLRTKAEDASRDLTLAIRELRARQDELSASDTARATTLLRRPPASDGWTDEQTRTRSGVRVHWDAGVATSAYVDQVLDVTVHVLATYAKAGYRAPVSDGTVGGGNGLFDVYLENIGARGYYGYCDAPPPSKSGPYDAPAYCVFDNDFSQREFPAQTPTDNLKVTAAHEIFHAVQFAYDYYEDLWFLEATAVWAEDEVYDAINDNRQYLGASPLRRPGKSLDMWTSTGSEQYGRWIFFRYLTERFTKQKGGMPVLVRRLLERVDGAKGGPDNYSIQAVAKELRSRGTSLRRVMAEFADANRRPARSYREGSNYPVARPAASFKLGSGKRNTGARKKRVDHLASTTIRFTPGGGVRKKHWHLRLVLDLPDRAAGSSAVVSVTRKGGRVATRYVKLNRHGNARLRVKFSSRQVRRVELTMANASNRYRCWVAGTDAPVQYSCLGKPRDENRPLRYRAKVIRS